jgi:hypothetical protein
VPQWKQTPETDARLEQNVPKQRAIRWRGADDDVADETAHPTQRLTHHRKIADPDPPLRSNAMSCDTLQQCPRLDGTIREQRGELARARAKAESTKEPCAVFLANAHPQSPEHLDVDDAAASLEDVADESEEAPPRAARVRRRTANGARQRS